MPIDPETITWDPAPQPVQPTQGGRSGGVIITDPTVAQRQQNEETRIDISGSSEARQQAAGSWNVMTPEEVDLAGLDKNIVWQRNGLGEMKAVPGQKEGTSEKGGDRKTKLETLMQQIDRVESLYNQNLRGGFPNAISGRVPGIVRPENEQFNSAAAGMAEQGLAAFRVPGAGSQSDAELRQFVEANKPLSSDSDLAIQEKLRTLRQRAQNELAAMGGANGEGALTSPGPSALEQSTAPKPEISGTEETFYTERDREILGRINAAYQSGASLEELKAIAAEYGATIPIGSEEELQKARAEKRPFAINPTGRRNQAQETLGKLGDTKGGAYFIKAANALSSGYMDELMGALGGDAEAAQAAKEYLQKEYPVASIAGEISGQAMQLAMGGSALKGAGLGARALAAGEIAQGAAYGSGEMNDNRLLGAGIGAGGAVLGQQMAKRLIEPAAQSVIQRIAGEAGVPPEVVQQAAEEALSAVPARAEPLAEAAQTEVGKLARKAMGGVGSKSAKEQLAIMAQVNPEAKAAAERLGIDLPVDILSDSAQVKTLAGLTRSQIGSEADTAWRATVDQAKRRSDQALEELGASPDLAQVGADTLARMEADANLLQTQAQALRQEVTDNLDVRARVEANRLQQELGGTINDLGGLKEAKQAMSAEERKMLAMLGEGEKANMPTYARLNQMRDQIGDALFKKQGPWADTAEANLKRYYGALADDQINYIERTMGPEIADKMRGSNTLFSQMYKSREAMQAVFGAQLEKSLPPLINRAITKASKGDAQELNKLLANVPENMRAKAVLSGIMADATTRSAGGGFSFARFAQTYRGLRQNSPVYKEIAKTVGPEGARILNDLYAISRRVAEGESRIVRTGASTQPLLNALSAENLISKVMKGTARRTAVTGAAATMGGIAGGIPGGAMGASISEAMQEALTKSGKSSLDKLHGLLSSDAFRALAEAPTKEVQDKALNRLAGSKEWNNFAARVLGLKTPEQRRTWIREAIVSSGIQGATGLPANPGETTIELVPQ